MSSILHTEYIANVCRVCARNIPPKSQKTSVKRFKDAILETFSVNIQEDSSAVHPPSICQKCRMQLERLQKTSKRTSLQSVAVFQPHTEDDSCICSRKRGRPKPTEPVFRTDVGTESGVNVGASTSSGATSSHETASHKRKLFETEEEEEEVQSEDKTVIVNIEIERFVNQEVASTYTCIICRGLPYEVPLITSCDHIFCTKCISYWLEKAGSCPTCRSPMTTEDLNPLSGHLLNIFDTLKVKCLYSNKGCNMEDTVKNIKDHESRCEYERKKTTTPGNLKWKSLRKAALYDVGRQYVKNKRLKPLLDNINSFCTEQYESKEDVLFFALRSHLYDSNDRHRAEAVESLWFGAKPTRLTPEECLAMRVDLLMTKNSYAKEYALMKSKDLHVLSPPSELNALEVLYMPGTARYSVQGDLHSDHYYHTPVKTSAATSTIHGKLDSLEPISIVEDFNVSVPDFPSPNTKGVTFPYCDAVAKTLEELDDVIVSGLESLGIDPNDPSLVIHTIIKDGADGMGDVSVHKEASDRFLPDKALRFSFCVLKCSVEKDGEEVPVFTEDNPNSIRSNRPLLEAIGDENDKSTVSVCILPIEQERLVMKDKIMRVIVGDNVKRSHYLTFVNSMIDEKWDRSWGGLQGAGSKFLCTLCDASRTEAFEKAGSYTVTRTLKQCKERANIARLNPDNLSEVALKDVCCGVKAQSMLTCEPKERAIDATHSDINMGSYFKTLIVREIAGVSQWGKTADVSDSISQAEAQFDRHLKATIGINPALMMPGNYARELFDENNAAHVVSLVPSADKQAVLKEALSKFRTLRKVYRCTWPLKELPELVHQYKTVAVEMVTMIRDNFPYASCTNYLHKITEHVQELIEDPSGAGSIGALSSEGNEAGNKLFRQLRLGHSRKGNTLNGLRDVLWIHWLYSSKKLQSKASVTHNVYECGNCGGFGHNRRTCKN